MYFFWNFTDKVINFVQHWHKSSCCNSWLEINSVWLINMWNFYRASFGSYYPLYTLVENSFYTEITQWLSNHFFSLVIQIITDTAVFRFMTIIFFIPRKGFYMSFNCIRGVNSFPGLCVYLSHGMWNDFLGNTHTWVLHPWYTGRDGVQGCMCNV